MDQAIRPSLPVVHLDRLLDAEPLGLSLRIAPKRPGSIAIEWTATSELLDPTPFLGGREMLLTTGAQIDAHDDLEVRDYFARLASRGIAVVGFGVGLSYDEIPDTFVKYCAQFGIALLEVPYETPFVAISRMVADAVAEQKYAEIARAQDIHDQLVQALTAESGLDTMLATLSEITAAAFCVVDFYGVVLGESPRNLQWPLELVLARRMEPEPWQLDNLSVTPIVLDGIPAATFVTRGLDEHSETIQYARGLVAIELAKRRSVLVARRESLGLVIEDVLHGYLVGRGAERRLERFGVDLSNPNAVIVAATSSGRCCPPSAVEPPERHRPNWRSAASSRVDRGRVGCDS